MAKPTGRPSDGEIEILRLIWDRGQMGVKDVQDALGTKDRSPALTTVATRIKRMEDKGLIAAVDDRRPKIYKAMIGQDATAGSLVGDVLNRVFGGSAGRMVLHLLNRKPISAEEQKKIREVLDRLE